MHTSKTQAQSPMSSFNQQLTMVQLTIDNSKGCQIPNPKFSIPAACPRCPIRPICSRCFRCSRRSRCSRCFRERAMPGKKQNIEKCGMPMRRPARQQGLNIQSDIPNLRVSSPRVRKGSSSNSEFGIRTSNRPAKAGTQNSGNLEFGIWSNKQPAKAGTQNPERFRRFTNFWCFISFIRFSRFRCIYS